MNLAFNASVTEFRAEVADWLAAHAAAPRLPSVDTAEGRDGTGRGSASPDGARHGSASDHGPPACG